MRRLAAVSLVAACAGLSVSCLDLASTEEPEPTRKLSVTPASGWNDEPTEVVLHGAGFASDAQLTVGATPAVIGNTSATEIVAMVPAGLSPGKHDVTLTQASGTTTCSDCFEAKAPVHLSGLVHGRYDYPNAKVVIDSDLVVEVWNAVDDTTTCDAMETGCFELDAAKIVVSAAIDGTGKGFAGGKGGSPGSDGQGPGGGGGGVRTMCNDGSGRGRGGGGAGHGGLGGTAPSGTSGGGNQCCGTASTSIGGKSNNPTLAAMGSGGGGGGDGNNASAPGGAGGAGGAMIVLRATQTISGAGSILVRGEAGSAPAGGQYAGGAGGGAGGSVLFFAKQLRWTGVVDARGGDGGDCVGGDAANSGASGGGGSGGVIIFQAPEVVSAGTQSVDGGSSGACPGIGCGGTLGKDGEKGLFVTLKG